MQDPRIDRAASPAFSERARALATSTEFRLLEFLHPRILETLRPGSSYATKSGANSDSLRPRTVDVQRCPSSRTNRDQPDERDISYGSRVRLPSLKYSRKQLLLPDGFSSRFARLSSLASGGRALSDRFFLSPVFAKNPDTTPTSVSAQQPPGAKTGARIMVQAGDLIAT